VGGYASQILFYVIAFLMNGFDNHQAIAIPWQWLNNDNNKGKPE
jgi:hypothetical protein